MCRSVTSKAVPSVKYTTYHVSECYHHLPQRISFWNLNMLCPIRRISNRFLIQRTARCRLHLWSLVFLRNYKVLKRKCINQTFTLAESFLRCSLWYWSLLLWCSGTLPCDVCTSDDGLLSGTVTTGTLGLFLLGELNRSSWVVNRSLSGSSVWIGCSKFVNSWLLQAPNRASKVLPSAIWEAGNFGPGV